jgi:hypothetical protein
MSKQNNKGLQRFTDFDSLRTVEEFTELSILDNDKFLELFVWLQDKLKEALKRRSQRWRDRPIFYQAGEDITYNIQ